MTVELGDQCFAPLRRPPQSIPQMRRIKAGLVAMGVTHVIMEPLGTYHGGQFRLQDLEGHLAVVLDVIGGGTPLPFRPHPAHARCGSGPRGQRSVGWFRRARQHDVNQLSNDLLPVRLDVLSGEPDLRLLSTLLGFFNIRERGGGRKQKRSQTSQNRRLSVCGDGRVVNGLALRWDLFHRCADVFPCVETPADVAHSQQPHALHGLCGERRTQAAVAVEDELLVFGEERLVIGTVGIDPELEHTTRCMESSLNRWCPADS